jgi:hypothetical protein
LRIVAVHAPRDAAETDAEAVREAVSLNNVTEPCAVDNGHKLRDAFQIEQDDLPAYYLFDAEGSLRSFASGSSALDGVESAIETVLGASPSSKEEPQ